MWYIVEKDQEAELNNNKSNIKPGYKPGWRSSKGSGSALWYSSVSLSTSSDILKNGGGGGHGLLSLTLTSESNCLQCTWKFSHLVNMLTRSWVLPCCSRSHCSSRAVSSAFESTLPSMADAIRWSARDRETCYIGNQSSLNKSTKK